MSRNRGALAKRITLLAGLVSIVTSVPACGSAPAAGETAAAPDITAGRALYRQHCSHCHGFNLVNPGVSAPDLRRFPAADKARFIETVNSGRNGMPAWQLKLSAADIEALWTYVSASAVQSAAP